MKLSLLSKYRTYIMGAAMIWVMWFHSLFTGKTDVFHFIHDIGFYGVDMFLMVSGLGLYFSMRKSKNALDFYKKRAIRILPAYLIVVLAWYLFFKTDVSTGDKILSILGINYFRGTVYSIPERFDWFIPTLLLFYLLVPLYDKLFQKATVKWKFTCLACLISPILCIVTYHTHMQPLYGSIVRIPIFLIGYNIGWFLYEKKEEQKGSWMVYIPLMTVGLIAGYYFQKVICGAVPNTVWGINAYPATFVAPGISILIALLVMFAHKYLKIVGKIITLPFYICGRYSLEIYLIHQRLMTIVNGDSAVQLRNVVISKVGLGGYYFAIALATVAIAAALHELVALVTRLIRGKGRKKPENTEEKKEAEAADKEATVNAGSAAV